MSSQVSFAAQLQDVDPVAIGRSTYDLVIVDVDKDGTRPFTSAEIRQMGGGGAQPKTVLGYVSIGEAEDYRSYFESSWTNRSPSWLGPENPDWEGNYQVRFWDAGWQDVILARIANVVKAGFNGTFLDVVDVYQSAFAQNASANAEREMVAFVKEISAFAKGINPDFVIYVNGAEELLAFTDYVSAIDGVLKESIYYGNSGTNSRNSADAISWTTGLLDRAAAAGKTVLNIEYVTSATAKSDVQKLAERDGYSIYVSDPSLSVLPPSPDPQENGPTAIVGTSRSDTLRGGADAETLFGLDDDDFLSGGLGNDLLNGGPGNDTADYSGARLSVKVALKGAELANVLVGAAAGDRVVHIENVIGGSGNDRMVGCAGGNWLVGNAGADALSGASGNDVLNGGSGSDGLSGGHGRDRLFGGSGNDRLNSGTGNDHLMGGSGRDVFKGGLGADHMWAGQDNDRDRFVFTSQMDSGLQSGRDQLFNFDRSNYRRDYDSDLIDLRSIDADRFSAGDQAFRFVKAFHTADRGAADGQVRVVDSGKDLTILLDVNGDNSADMAILVVGVDFLTSRDFLL
jgi:cysteinyl-tRNA synthetase